MIHRHQKNSTPKVKSTASTEPAKCAMRYPAGASDGGPEKLNNGTTAANVSKSAMGMLSTASTFFHMMGKVVAHIK